MHIGVDAGTGLVRRAELTSAKVYESEVADGLVSGDERAVYGIVVWEGTPWRCGSSCWHTTCGVRSSCLDVQSESWAVRRPSRLGKAVRGLDAQSEGGVGLLIHLFGEVHLLFFAVGRSDI